ncbi:MAG: molybdopterin-synthase adenylyltransferase MoeB [Gammaproteobacteria bacterium]|nr:molybdopterin-synthase adenylyltransferase MoeB [Gammaproteobacteria bacterium]
MNDQELLRYSRQIMLPAIGFEGQQTLLNAHVVILGLGGLGSPAALYLASAGVGQLTLCDFDHVDLSNLQRQILHNDSNIGQAKTDSAIESLTAINANISLNGINHKLDSEEMEALFKSADLVLDCTDNFETRFAINKASVASKTPLVSAAAIRFEGQITCFIPNDPKSPCYRCLYDDNSNDEAELCSENGVLAPVVGILGAMQALEAIKMLCHVGESLTNRLMLLDAMTMEWQSIKTKPDPQCPVCGTP